MDIAMIELLVVGVEKGAEAIMKIRDIIKNAGAAEDTTAAYIARIDKAMATVPAPHVG